MEKEEKENKRLFTPGNRAAQTARFLESKGDSDDDDASTQAPSAAPTTPCADLVSFVHQYGVVIASAPGSLVWLLPHLSFVTYYE